MRGLGFAAQYSDCSFVAPPCCAWCCCVVSGREPTLACRDVGGRRTCGLYWCDSGDSTRFGSRAEGATRLAMVDLPQDGIPWVSLLGKACYKVMWVPCGQWILCHDGSRACFVVRLVWVENLSKGGSRKKGP